MKIFILNVSVDHSFKKISIRLNELWKKANTDEWPSVYYEYKMLYERYDHLRMIKRQREELKK